MLHLPVSSNSGLFVRAVSFLGNPSSLLYQAHLKHSQGTGGFILQHEHEIRVLAAIPEIATSISLGTWEQVILVAEPFQASKTDA